jgi:predicted alpha/beta hydrolase family esterase
VPENQGIPQRVVILHGNGEADSQTRWLPWMKSELEALGIVVEVPDMPDMPLARAEVWLKYMADVLKIDEATYVIGWSTGAVAIMRYAQNHKIFGSCLVAPAYTDLDDENEKASGWFVDEWQWEKIRANNLNGIMQFSSDNDKFYEGRDEAEVVHLNLQTELHMHSRKHYGQMEQPEILEAVTTKLQLPCAA